MQLFIYLPEEKRSPRRLSAPRQAAVDVGKADGISSSWTFAILSRSAAKSATRSGVWGVRCSIKAVGSPSIAAGDMPCAEQYVDEPLLFNLFAAGGQLIPKMRISLLSNAAPQAYRKMTRATARAS